MADRISSRWTRTRFTKSMSIMMVTPGRSSRSNFSLPISRKDIALTIGPAGNQRTNAIPLVQAGQIFSTNSSALNVNETYTIKLIKGNRRTGTAQDITNAKDGSKTFTKPVDYIGTKTLPDYEAYVDSLTYNINIPGSQRRAAWLSPSERIRLWLIWAKHLTW